ncbi:hypothetical protein F4777DRAFT_490047 [Nemania sp. FL0916]|nr:hypothetical protein F4777DRAFT_490047 [Nemania sp. FL0916]
MDKLRDGLKAVYNMLGTTNVVPESYGDPELLQRRIWSSRSDSELEGEKGEKMLLSNDLGEPSAPVSQPQFLETCYPISRCAFHASENFHDQERQFDALTKKGLETVLIKSEGESYDARIFGDDITATSKYPNGITYWEVFIPGVLNEDAFIPNDPSTLKLRKRNAAKQNAATQATRKDSKYESEASISGAGDHAIRIMSLDPMNIAEYGFIFGTKDLPGLRDRLDTCWDGKEKPPYLIAINATAPTKQYYLHWDTLKVIAPLSVKDTLYYDPALMGNRYSCGGVIYEPEGQDWFG